MKGNYIKINNNECDENNKFTWIFGQDYGQLSWKVQYMREGMGLPLLFQILQLRYCCGEMATIDVDKIADVTQINYKI